MKIFKYFTWSEIKEICIKLSKEHCYFRNTKKNFVKILGEDTTNSLVKMGWLKDSPYIPNCYDYIDPCYEYGIIFRKLFNYHVNPFGIWLKYYVFQFGWFKYKWQLFRIWCGHHYDWQDYSNCNLDKI